jgi:hypothetical protein
LRTTFTGGHCTGAGGVLYRSCTCQLTGANELVGLSGGLVASSTGVLVVTAAHAAPLSTSTWTGATTGWVGRRRGAVVTLGARGRAWSQQHHGIEDAACRGGFSCRGCAAQHSHDSITSYRLHPWLRNGGIQGTTARSHPGQATTFGLCRHVYVPAPVEAPVFTFSQRELTQHPLKISDRNRGNQRRPEQVGAN